MRKTTIIIGLLIMSMLSSLALYAEDGGIKNIVKDKLKEYVENKDVKSLIFVKYMGGSEAQVSLFKKDKDSRDDKDLFYRTSMFHAYIGKNGIGKEKEGDSKTPLGDYGIIQAFGIKANPGTTIEYLNINKNHYCCDENCQYYNKIIDAEAVNHKCKGEHIIDYVPQYNYGFFIDYNKEGVYPKGSAIFFHVKGKKPYTAGCIAVKEEDMITILKEIDANTRVIIYGDKNAGTFPPGIK